MNLDELELACAALGYAMMQGVSLEEEFEHRGILDHAPAVKKLLDDGQFYVLLDLRRVEQHIERAYEKANAPQTEYLRDDLDDLLGRIRLLLIKMGRDEILRQDRDALLSPFLPDH